jgi:peptidoglycan-N-acetylglucosamine deacetylase
VIDTNSSLDVEVPRVADAPVLTERLKNLADGYVRSFRRTVRQQSGKGRYHGMSIDWQLIGRSRRVIGVEMWVTQQHGTLITIARRTVWYDQATRHLLELSNLFQAASWHAVERAMVHALIKAGLPTRSPRAATAQALLRGGRPAFGFSAKGELVLTFAAPAPPSGVQPVSLKLQGAAIGSQLSPAGLQVRDSARSTSAPQPSASPDCRRHRCLALTFDDGPSSFTPGLVALLRQRKVAATFFLVGERVQQAPDLLADMNAAGMEVGNHSTYHHDLTSLPAATMRTDLRETSRLIAAVTGHEPRLMRPPYGARNRKVDRVAKELGMTEILWDVDTLDWRYPDAPRLTRVVQGSARQGSIVLMHDAINRTTITAMPAIIDRLQRRGFQLVTVSQLLGTTRPGQVYRRTSSR